ncbi:MAG: cytochrome c family protein [candidate division Zixibacteria bacterium]|nr:cytochrome c family protein [candidate division Zixibacteria bacterium]MDH3936523.1 cytochrome c family protein [candidate division Zixibacteria bacterium]MDH4034102.1 cytochrome c family protein [candidate division Zixibacteria bacterium]
MRRFFIILTALAVMAFLFAGAVYSEEAAKKADHAYVGAKKCSSKACHKDKHTSWAETAHAGAFDKLSAEEQKKPECIKCHSTGTLADGTLIEGIECEACHGPGKDYKSAKIMSKKKWKADPEAQMKMAVDAGLIVPDEKVCVRCHTKEGNTNFKEFKFAERVKLVHPVKEEKPAEK